MIPARKNRLFRAWFAGHARTRIERSFGCVRVDGIEHARTALDAGPVLLVSNHTSWWDPLVVLFLTEHVLRCDGHALMDATNLRRLPFFALVGAFGVDRSSAADGAAAIRYATRLLDAPRRMVWVFAQGRERPVTERPLDFHGGSAVMAKVAGCATVPAGLRYEHRGEALPELILCFGAPLPPPRTSAEGRRAQESAVVACLDRIEVALCDGSVDAWPELHRSRHGIIEAWSERALAWLTRA